MNLAFRLRPQTLEDFIGQEHLVGKGSILRRMLEEKQLFSMLFWGPPGTGKTTLAHIIANELDAKIYALSAVEAGKAQLQEILKQVQDDPTSSRSAGLRGARQTILFLDEIHRWNKAQQDALLPFVESGLLILIGATTENPSFEVNSALLSRCRVFVLKSLEEKDLKTLIERALTDKEKGLGKYKKVLTPEAKDLLIQLSGGDARIMLNGLEMAITSYKEKTITPEIIVDVFQTRSAGLYDKKADEHYNTISAFIKSMRGSSPDGALYYLARMLENGEDPTFVARRMIIFAAEDIGLADRGALIQANGCFEAVEKIGMPEAQLILAYTCLYLSTAKKSRAVANALGKAKEAVYEFPNAPIPLHLRNAPTKLMKDLNYSKGYKWSEKYVGPTENQSFLPEKLKGKIFFEKV
ncbi:MAG TPA: replication-associated recombination protein A [Patescibacteria group bacterium]|nr:replication-associated recombination protein A [Patescibacteria group bacterium]